MKKVLYILFRMILIIIVLFLTNCSKEKKSEISDKKVSVSQNFSKPASVWEKNFDKIANEWAYSVQSTEDSGYIITGYTKIKGEGKRDVYLLKTDAEGNKEWEKTYGGHSNDWGESIQLTKDGGYIIVGRIYFIESSIDVYLIKTDSVGNKQWERMFGGIASDVGSSVQLTKDGGYIIAGMTESKGAGECDVYLIKTDINGEKEWENTFGGKENDWGNSVQLTKDDGYIIAGMTESKGIGERDIYLIKTDDKGNMQWEKTFGRASEDYCNSVQLTKDDGYIIAGYTKSNETDITRTFAKGEGYGDGYLIKIDEEGNVSQ